MNDSSPWKEFWERKAHPDTPDHVFDRGSPARAPEVEELSRLELLDFIDPRESEYVLDAGCGTGGNVLLLSSKVSRLIALDFASAALARARQRLTASSISNALLVCGTVSALPLPDRSVDKIICLSVLQYMDDAEVRRTFSEFARVVRVGGVLILHVKNLASLYLFSLLVAKRFKQLLGRRTVIEHFRTYRWYVDELKAAGFDVTDYASSNLFMLESLQIGRAHV